MRAASNSSLSFFVCLSISLSLSPFLSLRLSVSPLCLSLSLSLSIVRSLTGLSSSSNFVYRHQYNSVVSSPFLALTRHGGRPPCLCVCLSLSLSEADLQVEIKTHARRERPAATCLRALRLQSTEAPPFWKRRRSLCRSTDRYRHCQQEGWRQGGREGWSEEGRKGGRDGVRKGEKGAVSE